MSQPKHLVFFTDENPGFTRKKWGRGFRYYDEKDEPVKSKDHIKRIKALVIPPAWLSVWISPLAEGHLQCTGKDLKNRKQYLYHPDWLEYRQRQKFDSLLSFGKVLPKIRQFYKDGLRANEWTKKKVLALILYLLDHHYFRIGNSRYTKRNETYGLTTLRRKHLEDLGKGLAIAYTAKGNKLRHVQLTNQKIIKMIREISELPGYEIFRYQDSNNTYVNITSQDVNEYLFEITNNNFTAKDFRTWGATVLVLENAHKAKKMVEENTRLKPEPTLVKLVADSVGNTVTVCRKYYIHPDVLDYLKKNDYQLKVLEKGADKEESITTKLSEAEELIMDLLDNN